MSLKVAVASTDGKVINRHFGNSPQFLIFNVSIEGFEYQETRELSSPCSLGEHSDDLLKKAVDLLSDCDIVLATRIGYGALSLLESKHIKAFQTADYIEETLRKISASSYLSRQV